MRLFTYDVNLQPTGEIINYEGLRWESSLYEHSTASLKCRIEPHVRDAVYLMRSDSKEVMCVTKRSAAFEQGNSYIELSCIGASRLFDERIVYKDFYFNKSDVCSCIADMINDCIKPAPAIKRQAMPYMKPASYITSGYKVSTQIGTGSISQGIEKLCESAFLAGVAIGYCVIYDGTSLVPYIWQGSNKTLDVVFSDTFYDISKGVYTELTDQYRDRAIVYGEGEGNDRKFAVAQLADPCFGKELYVDARDLKSEKSDKTTLSAAEYNNVLVQRGIEKLSELPASRCLEVTISGERFMYGRDYNLGDRVSFEAFGLKGSDIVTKLSETFEQGAKTIELTLGTSSPTVAKLLRKA